MAALENVPLTEREMVIAAFSKTMRIVDPKVGKLEGWCDLLVRADQARRIWGITHYIRQLADGSLVTGERLESLADSGANPEAQNHDIPKSVLEKELKAIKTKGGPPPAADKLWKEIRDKYPQYCVIRADVREVHKGIFGELGPGKRRRDG